MLFGTVTFPPILSVIRRFENIGSGRSPRQEGDFDFKCTKRVLASSRLCRGSLLVGVATILQPISSVHFDPTEEYAGGCMRGGEDVRDEPMTGVKPKLHIYLVYPFCRVFLLLN